MPRIRCTIEGAPLEIGGLDGIVKFEPVPIGGLLSEEVSDEVAAHFASIPGYALSSEVSTADDAAAMDALRARAAAIGLKLDSRWKLARATAEVEHAEKQAAGAA